MPDFSLLADLAVLGVRVEDLIEAVQHRLAASPIVASCARGVTLAVSAARSRLRERPRKRTARAPKVTGNGSKKPTPREPFWRQLVPIALRELAHQAIKLLLNSDP